MTKKEQQELKRKAKKAKKIAKKTKKVAKKMGYKKFFLLLVIVIAILVGGFFGYSYYKYQDPFYFFKPQVEEPNTPDTPIVGEGNVFEHQLYEKNMKNKDSMTVNGLTFKFPNMAYSEYDKGIKLGSSSKPINENEAWTIETTFPETTIKSFEFVIANNKDGTTYFTVDFGSNSSKASNDKTEETAVTYSNLNIKTSSLKLTLYNTKGCYLKSLKIVFDNPPFKVFKDNVVFGEVKPDGVMAPITNFAVISKEQYYKDIDFSQTGEHLREALHVRVNDGKQLNSYGDARYMLVYTDERVDKKGVLYSVYDANEIKPEWSSNVWNREHVWPCSKMVINGLEARPKDSDKDHRSDLHNLRALTRSLNIERNNLYFAEEDGKYTFFPNKSKDIKDDFRGDVARIILYMALTYDGLEIVESPTETGHQMGQLSSLIKWANEDPVDDFEIQRNNRIYEYQGNRNPFIDYPEIVNKLYA